MTDEALRVAMIHVLKCEAPRLLEIMDIAPYEVVEIISGRLFMLRDGPGRMTMGAEDCVRNNRPCRAPDGV